METVDIVREVVSNIDNAIALTSIVDNADGTYLLNTNDTLHLQDGFPLVIGGNDYTIVTVVKDVSVLISGSVLPVLTSFNVYAPVYFHGTVIRVNAEMKTTADAQNIFSRTPFIYLKEVLTDKVNSKFNKSPIEKETTLKILFLTQSKFKDWKTTEHYSKSIYQMTNLANRFIESCYANKTIWEFQDYEMIPHANFGVYVDNGHNKSIFEDQLSGIEMNISLPFLRQDECN
jgi:hypothetical protein